jgi:putative ABC transport system permease protein
MGWLESIRTAWKGVSANAMRSFLTILGVLIGVASVVTLVAVGNGASVAVARQFQNLGTNTLTVFSGGFGRGGGGPGGGGGGAAPLTNADVKLLQESQYKSSIKAVVPVVNVSSVSLSFVDVTAAPAQFRGTTAEMADAGAWKVSSGRFFNDDDVENRRRVVVLGATTASNLFGEESPTGQKVGVNLIEFEVIGVLKAKGSNGAQDQDDIGFVPMTTVRDTLIGGSTLNQIIVQATSAKATEEAQTVVTNVLTGRHLLPNGQAGFRVLNQTSLLQSSTESSKTLTVLLGAVAAISLLVGGIGIMNIMLVTVTERTREIGIRKAIGAPKRAILRQFLLEAVFLGGMGGVIGCVVGIVGSRFKIVGTQPVIRYDSVILAFGVAIAVSLFFGIFPANRAASLRPIDALRHE